MADTILPRDLWEEDQDAVITSWLVNDGSTVKEGALVAAIMTAKVQYEIHAPATGTISIKEVANADVPKGAVIGTVA